MKEFLRSYFLWLAKLLTLVVVALVVPVIGIILLASSAAMLSKHEVVSGVDPAKKIAVIELTGVITDAKEILEDLYKQGSDPTVKGIVLRVDSPGGAVGPSQEIYSAVKRLKAKKPIVVSMGTVAASGGLYSSLGATKILAQPGTLTGSIGVILEIPNFTDVASKIGVQMLTVKSGKFKDAGNSFRKPTDDDIQYFQGTIDAAYKDFLTAVSDSRKIPIEKARTFADGRIILGSQAKELGLIDGFGDIEDAGRMIFEINNEPLAPSERPYLFYPGEKYRELKKILDSISPISFFGRLEGIKISYLMQ